MSQVVKFQEKGMQWLAQAPSNIALIKYMGKEMVGENVPINPSISYTLKNLISSVMLELHPGKKSYWENLDIPGALKFSLSAPAQARFLNHLDYLKRHFNYSGSFIVRSCNNFPHSSGLASSASSFAALTKCAVLALCELTGTPTPSIEEQARLSQAGSGSSCRSFFSPWAIWEGESISQISLPYEKLLHQVVIISHDEKEVSSSEAHQRVRTSTQFESRSLRAQKNLKLLLQAFEAKDWQSAYQICWNEFQDMHKLFSTSNPSFSYLTNECQIVLNKVQDLWESEGDGPIVTMDAGPNIHLLYRPEQTNLAHRFKQQHLVGNYDIF